MQVSIKFTERSNAMMSVWNLFWIIPLAAMLGILLLAIVSGGPPDDQG